jgi:hypothetical protein
VEKLGMVGVNGGKFPAIREHLSENIGGVYKDMDLTFVHLSIFRTVDSRNIRKKGKLILKPVGEPF